MSFCIIDYIYIYVCVVCVHNSMIQLGFNKHEVIKFVESIHVYPILPQPKASGEVPAAS